MILLADPHILLLGALVDLGKLTYYLYLKNIVEVNKTIIEKSFKSCLPNIVNLTVISDPEVNKTKGTKRRCYSSKENI